MTDTPKHTPEIPPFSAEVATTALRMWTCYHALAGIPDPAAFVARAKAIEALLIRARVYVESDAQMVADITRHAPLAEAEQLRHDTTEAPSERLLVDIDKALALPGGAEQ